MEVGRIYFIFNRGLVRSGNPNERPPLEIEVKSDDMQKMSLDESLMVMDSLMNTALVINRNILASMGRTAQKEPLNGS